MLLLRSKWKPQTTTTMIVVVCTVLVLSGRIMKAILLLVETKQQWYASKCVQSVSWLTVHANSSKRSLFLCLLLGPSQLAVFLYSTATPPACIYCVLDDRHGPRCLFFLNTGLIKLLASGNNLKGVYTLRRVFQYWNAVES